MVASGNGRAQDDDLEDTLTGLEAPTIAAPAPAAAAVAEREWGPALDDGGAGATSRPRFGRRAPLGTPRGARRARAGLRDGHLRGCVLGAHAGELHRRGRGRERRGLPGRALGSRGRRPPVPAALREPAPGACSSRPPSARSSSTTSSPPTTPPATGSTPTSKRHRPSFDAQESRARQPPPRRPADRSRLHGRLHRPSGRRLGRIALVRGLLPRRLRGGARDPPLRAPER